MVRAGFAPIDVAVLAGYVAITLAVGFRRRARSTQGYLIANRGLSLPVFVATLVATWYGGILGVGEMTYRYGIVNWSTQGLPYYVMAVLFALLLAHRVRSAEHYTIPDRLAEVFDRRTALAGAVGTFLMATPAPYILMVGQLVSVATGLPLMASMLIGLVFSAAYVYAGGFESDVRINVLQFCLMFAGFATALGYVAFACGGLGWLRGHLPSEHLRLDGGLGTGYIAVWFLIALWTFVDPGFHQRCYATRSAGIARTGVLIAVGCWLVFDTLTTSLGLYARAVLPNLPDAAAGMAYPLLAERLLPPGLKAFFYAAMLATVMSTVVSYTFISAMAVGRDVLWRLRPTTPERDLPSLTRVGLIFTAVLGLLVAAYVPSVVGQWWAIGTACVPGLLMPVLSSYAPRIRLPAGWTFAAMLGASGTSTACLAIGWVRHGLAAEVSDSTLFPFGLQPLYPGLAASLLVYLVGWAVVRACGRTP